MTGSVSPAPVLVLGLGNMLLSDDGVGLRLLEMLKGEPGEIEFVDGGTQGLALMPYLQDRSALLLLDAIALDGRPGTVHVVLKGEIESMRACRASTAHESGALELLEMARLLGYEFQDVSVVGIEPANIRTGLGLSEAVEASLEPAAERARGILSEMVAHVSCCSR